MTVQDSAEVNEIEICTNSFNLKIFATEFSQMPCYQKAVDLHNSNKQPD